MTETLCLLPVPGVGVLGLTPEELQRALSRGREAARGPDIAAPGLAADAGHAGGSETLLDAQGMAAATGVPASWFETAAARDAIPSIKFGRWRRFDLQAVLASGVTVRGQRIIAREAPKTLPQLPLARRLRNN